MILKIIKWFEKNYNISWLITIIIAIFIFYISSISFPLDLEPRNPLKPYLYHFGIFLLFSFFLMLFSIRGKHKSYFYLSIFLSVLYAILDELHQSFVPFRDASISDVLTDSFGISFAILIYIISLVYRRNGNNKK